RAARAGPQRDETAQQYRDRINALESQLSTLDAVVRQQREFFATEAGQLKVIDRASRALDRGLVNQALKLLWDPALAEVDATGLRLEIELLLLLGRASEARDWLQPDHLAMIGELDYRWIRARTMAVMGDYAAADEELVRMIALTLPARGDLSGESL